MTVPTKIRLRFAKCGDLRLVSHHDLMRCLERSLRRAALPMAYSQGFNPRPKLSFPLALALGIEGHREPLELELAEPLSASEVLQRLQPVAPPGFDLFEAEVTESRRAPRVASASYRLNLPRHRHADARSALTTLLASERWPYTRQRPQRTTEFDLRPFVRAAELDPEGTLSFRLKIDPSGSARPEELLEALGLRDLLEQGEVLIRTDVELAPDIGL